jgi:hypothetical protein
MNNVTEYNQFRISLENGKIKVEHADSGTSLTIGFDNAVKLAHGKTITTWEGEAVSYDQSRLSIFGQEHEVSAIFGWILEKMVREAIGL